jgi:hypothetical protein
LKNAPYRSLRIQCLAQTLRHSFEIAIQSPFAVHVRNIKTARIIRYFVKPCVKQFKRHRVAIAIR